MLVLPLFKSTGNILLQIAPGNVPPSAFTKCSRQVNAGSVVLHLVECKGGKTLRHVIFYRSLLVKMSPKYGKADSGSLYLVKLSDL